MIPDFSPQLTCGRMLACASKEETLERKEKSNRNGAMHYTRVHFGREGWNFENRPSHRGVIAYTWFELLLVTQTYIHCRIASSQEHYKTLLTCILGKLMHP